MAGAWNWQGWRNCSALSIIFILAGWPFFSPGKLANFTRLRCAKHWIDNQGCTASRQKFRMIKSIMLWEIFAVQMAAVCGQSCGAAINSARFRRQSCRWKNLILPAIRSKRWAGRDHPPSPRLRRTRRPRLQRQVRCCARSHAICSSQNAARWSKTRTNCSGAL